MTRDRGEPGFTIIELLVSIGVFSLVSVGMYQVLFSATEGSEAAQDGITVSEEARLGFNRLVRDTREADTLAAISSTSFDVVIDFDGNGTIQPTPADPAGDYERLTISFDRAARTISMSPGPGNKEVLMRGVRCIVETPTCSVFSFSSSRLEFDTDGNGVTTAAELEIAVGNGNGTIDGSEIGFIDIVSFSMKVQDGGAQTDFYADAQLRNRR